MESEFKISSSKRRRRGNRGGKKRRVKKCVESNPRPFVLPKISLFDMKLLATEMKWSEFLEGDLTCSRCRDLVRNRMKKMNVESKRNKEEFSRAMAWCNKTIERKKREREAMEEEERHKKEMEEKKEIAMANAGAQQRQFLVEEWARLIVAPVWIVAQWDNKYISDDYDPRAGFIEYAEIIKRPRRSLNVEDIDAVLRFKRSMKLRSNYFYRANAAGGCVEIVVPTVVEMRGQAIGAYDYGDCDGRADEDIDECYYSGDGKYYTADEIFRIEWSRRIYADGRKIDYLKFRGGDVKLIASNVHMVALNVCSHDLKLPLDICKIVLSYATIRKVY